MGFRFIAIACLLVFATLLVAPAMGNGGYFPPQAYPAMPAIPRQQAIIVHRDGSETLVVESAFQTDAPQVAWVLPVPAIPTRLELGAPGEISSALFAARPVIVHGRAGDWQPAAQVTVVAAIFALIMITNRNARSRWTQVKLLLLVLVLGCCLIAILLPSLGKSRGGEQIDGVSILSAQRLGDAEFTTLSATNPAALSKWLEERSLRPLDPAAERIVQDYIARGWRFVVGQLQRAGDGVNVPRPLVVTFPAARPVFPMKLTAIAGTTTRVELFVISDQEASASSFHRAVTDRMERHPADRDSDGRIYRSATYVGERTAVIVGSPDVFPRMWPGCVITKLTADLTPAAMDHDVELELRPFGKGYRDQFYTDVSRRQIVLTVLFVGLALWLAMAAFIGAGRRIPSRRQFAVMAALLGVIAIGCTATWFSLETIPIHTASGRKFIPYRRVRNLNRAASSLAKAGLIRPHMTPAELAAISQLMIDKAFAYSDETENPYTGEAMRPERSPGNFSIREVGGELFFSLYNADGVEESVLLPPAEVETAPATRAH